MVVASLVERGINVVPVRAQILKSDFKYDPRDKKYVPKMNVSLTLTLLHEDPYHIGGQLFELLQGFVVFGLAIVLHM